MGDGFHPFTAPYLRALEAKSFIDNLKAQKEDREYQREQRRMALEQQQRQNQIHDAQFTMALQSMGAIPAEQGATNRIDQIMQQAASIEPENRRQIIQTPMGQYRLPNQGDRQKRAITDATAVGTAKGYEKIAEDKIYDPNVRINLGEELGGEVDVPRSKVADIRLKAYEKLHPEDEMHVYGPNDAGDYTTVYRDKRTHQERFRFTDSGTGKSARPVGAGRGAATKEPSPTREDIEKIKGEWRGGMYEKANITQAKLDIAKNGQPIDEARKAAQEEIDAVEKRLDIAATQEAKARIREQYIAGQSQGATSSAAKSATATREPVKASQLNDLLNRTNTKRAASGQTPLTINSLRKLLIERQVQIDDAQ